MMNRSIHIDHEQINDISGYVQSMMNRSMAYRTMNRSMMNRSMTYRIMNRSMMKTSDDEQINTYRSRIDR
ncbi:hypothetical protein QQG55_54560 [Brugia pahangi]